MLAAQLLEQARSGVAVWAPATETGGIAEAIHADVVVGHLAHERGRERNPIELHLGGAPPRSRAAEPARGSSRQQEALLPRMPFDGCGVRAQLVEQPAAAIVAERAGHADVVELAGIVVKAEQQRTDGWSVEPQPEPRHHALRGLFPLDLHHGSNS